MRAFVRLAATQRGARRRNAIQRRSTKRRNAPRWVAANQLHLARTFIGRRVSGAEDIISFTLGTPHGRRTRLVAGFFSGGICRSLAGGADGRAECERSGLHREDARAAGGG